MRNLTKLGALGIVVLLVACSATGGVSAISGGDIGAGGVSNSGGAGGAKQGGAVASGGVVIFTGDLAGQSGTVAKDCGKAVICTPTSCGNIVDECGALIECGYDNCAASLCNPANNQCTPCTPVTEAACGTDAVGGKNCGRVPDNCSGTIDCGPCSGPNECCGCGGTPSVCGISATGFAGNSGLKVTCIAGQKGCLCDDAGGCAAGLACTPQPDPLPSLCCSGNDCDGLPTSIGGTCTGSGVATCTPGVTVPTPDAGNDTCGYLATSFDESSILCGIYATGGGKDPAQIQAFFNDEKSMTLGCTTTTNPVSAMPSGATTGAVRYPQLGDPTCVDGASRPMRPTLYITDITFDPNCTAGDQQSGGTAYDPIAVFGTWKSAVGNKPGADLKTKNYWNLGAGADAVPTSVTNQCPCTAASCPGTGHNSKGFGTEVKYEAGLISGHSYRIQITGHDGDQTSGADAGEACVIFCAGTGVCPKMTCASYPTGTCGQQPDGCGDMIDCGPCCPTKKTCADYPVTSVGPQDDGCGGKTAYCNQIPR